MDKQQQINALEQATQKHKDRDRKRLIIDFDQAVKEQEAEPVVVRFQGEDYELPPEPPAWLPLFINRHQDDNGVISDEHNLEVISKLLGQDFAEKVIAENNFISFTLVNNKILSPLFQHWGLSFEDESKNEKARS